MHTLQVENRLSMAHLSCIIIILRHKESTFTCLCATYWLVEAGCLVLIVQLAINMI